MPISLKQVSALEKVQIRTSFDHREINSYSVLQGQRLSYQITIAPNGIWDKKEKVWIESELADYVRLYCVKDVVVDKPNRENVTNENYLLTEPGTLPDLLVPLEKQNNYITIFNAPVVIWVKIDIPASCKPGKYSVKFCINTPFDEKPVNSCEMEVTVLPAQLPEQNVKYTRWFYADCIADIHNAEIFSERHWKLIEEYIKVATDEGINMILVPTHTPPLDTAVGTTRPCVQLIDIEKKGDTVHILGVGKPTIKDMPKSGILEDPEDIPDSTVTLVVDQQKYFNYQVDNIDKAMACGNVMSALNEETSEGISSVMDSFVASFKEKVKTAS